MAQVNSYQKLKLCVLAGITIGSFQNVQSFSDIKFGMPYHTLNSECIGLFILIVLSITIIIFDNVLNLNYFRQDDCAWHFHNSFMPICRINRTA